MAPRKKPAEVSASPITVFACGGQRATCEFPLKGRKSGKLCGAVLGRGAPIIVDGGRVCTAHARLLGVKGA
jgi:hypothetical protein